MNKICPFGSDKNACDETCALYIAPDDINETVRNKLASLGVLSRDEGICSYKHIALCMGRNIFSQSK
ncbi:MAG: hypothetical protein MJ180_05540 [Candidatus Gastranaerophilales bacterium]|nr:hypothetical protein [Candidatus Gastranaerophilales bacterium]